MYCNYQPHTLTESNVNKVIVAESSSEVRQTVNFMLNPAEQIIDVRIASIPLNVL